MQQQLFITCPKYISPYLSEELTELGYPTHNTQTAGVFVEATMQDVMRLNLRLSCAHRVLLLVDEFIANSPEELYRRALKCSWEEYIPLDGYFSVISSVDHPSITNTQYAQQKLKDAIADRMRQKFGRRPDSGSKTDKSVVYLYWHKEKCSVYVDTSGTPISRRGYRMLSHIAPLNEILGAAIVRATAWDRNSAFINPMCGSGTLAIEAALWATNTPSQFLRDNFGFMHLQNYKESSWTEVRAVEMKKRNLTWDGKIIASDSHSSAVMATRKNTQAAGLQDIIDIRMLDFRKTPMPEGPGVVVLNPEYGERMGSSTELERVYEGIGDWFKEKCEDKRGYVFSGSMPLLKHIGLKSSRRIPFYNADIECRLVEYELYKGSRKQKAPVEGEAGGGD